MQNEVLTYDPGPAATTRGDLLDLPDEGILNLNGHDRRWRLGRRAARIRAGTSAGKGGFGRIRGTGAAADGDTEPSEGEG